MESYPEANPDYFGFTDLVGYRDFIVYVLSCAPDLFPEEDWLKPDKQMNLERAFVGLRYGLTLAKANRPNSTLLGQCSDLIERGFSLYLAGDESKGQRTLEDLDLLVAKLISE